MTKKEKIIEKIKKNKVGLILCSLLFVALCLLHIVRLTNNSHNYKIDNEVKTELVISNKIIKKASIVVSYASEYLYPQESFNVNPSFIPQNTPLIYIDDTNTYIYYKLVNNDFNFYITNGVMDNIIARYSYNNYVCTLITSGSDGYLYCINYNGNIVYNNFVVNGIVETIENLNIFGSTINYQPLWLGTITIGVNDDYTTGVNVGYENGYNIGYDIGYSEGTDYGYDNGLDEVLDYPNYFDLYTKEQYDDNYVNGQNNVITNPSEYDLYNQIQYDNNYVNGQNNVITNPNAFGLYNQTQYENNYNLGYRTAENEIEPSLAENGFKLMFNSILNAPINILNGLLNFELFGINLLNLFTFIFTCVLIGFVIKIFV